MSTVRYSAPLREAERDTFLPLMHELIGTAFDVIRPLFLSGTEIIAKADATPVTAADRGAELAMRALLAARHPEHGVLGEEFGEKLDEKLGEKPGLETGGNPAATQDGRPRYRWVLDPVDGTRAFITNCFLFGTLIALERWNDDTQRFAPILGAIGFPAAGLALIGHSAETRLYDAQGNERVVRVRACERIESATVLASSHWSTGEQATDTPTAHIGRLTARAKLYRTWGDCFGYFALATGGADVMLDPTLAYWDVAAIVPVIEGAGGQVSSWAGGDPLASPSLIATAGPLHEPVLRALRGQA